jgi:hypothetical protein
MFDILGINTIIGGVKGILDKFIHSPEDKAQASLDLGKLQHAVTQDALQFEIERVKAQSAVIIAEAKSGFLSRSWRPILMLSLTAILVNNFLVYPYGAGNGAVMLEFPPEFWVMLQVGIGGYIGARSAEKIIPAAIEKWRGSKSE